MSSFADVQHFLNIFLLALYTLLGTLCLAFAIKAYRRAVTTPRRMQLTLGIVSALAAIAIQGVVVGISGGEDVWFRFIPWLLWWVSFVNVLIATIAIRTDKAPEKLIDHAMLVLSPIVFPIIVFHLRSNSGSTPLWFSIAFYTCVIAATFFTRRRILGLLALFMQTHQHGGGRITKP